ncbi:hypothetical protein B0H13DRAFT_2072384 [Mycena leptocephala]|nr:hypothetical protein B0H13DRAFT_2072384 [Mycena leptocephala]
MKSATNIAICSLVAVAVPAHDAMVSLSVLGGLIRITKAPPPVPRAYWRDHHRLPTRPHRHFSAAEDTKGLLHEAAASGDQR